MWAYLFLCGNHLKLLRAFSFSDQIEWEIKGNYNPDRHSANADCKVTLLTLCGNIIKITYLIPKML